ncbi:fibromodulin [Alligator sinensis]|uniref:Fibromodulin n=2 Tax=Alligator TaxID=8495 RepID=A0A1U7S688_ALLSI|nr:fibromodulin [Alligator sinensis]XP_025061623.1 fibromodulin [Alligator sinensis]
MFNTMHWVAILILAGICGVSQAQYYYEDELWMQYLLRQARVPSYNYVPYYEDESPPYYYAPGEMSVAEPAPEPVQPVSRQCPQECDCPPNLPSAMYCDGRNLRYLPFVPSRMKYVYFQNNQITSIQEAAFDNATNLEWIALHGNQISSEKMGKKIFAKLKNLERLYLNNNNLTKMPGPLPRSLRELHLAYNQISKIPANALEGLENLTALYLSHNYIYEIAASFKGLKSLILVDLSYNHLRKVPDGLPIALEQLYLDYNYINTIPDEYFKVSPKLLYVRLAHNTLTNEGLASNAFNSSSILELDLSYNRFQKIPRVSTQLENLYLQGNQINEFSISSFCTVVDVMNFSRLQVLRLDGNEIQRNAMPPDAPLCLRRANVIEI